MLQSPAFAPPPIPLSHYPKKENCRKEKQQINGGERAEGNVNHGAEALEPALSRVTSLPHSTVAIPHVSG
jgi:hypothetical protein